VAGMKQVRALALLGRGGLRKKKRGVVKSAGGMLMCSLLPLLLWDTFGCLLLLLMLLADACLLCNPR
jgi:hypothetical protein